jgi:hypothetical protein
MQFLRIILSTISAILALNLLVATSGLPVVYHFCGDSISSVSLGVSAATPSTDTGCDCPADDDTDCAKDCCRTELHVSELHTDALLPFVEAAPQLASASVSVMPFCAVLFAGNHRLSYSLAHDTTSPPFRPFDLPVLYRSLLI